MHYSKETEEYINYVVDKLKQGKNFSKVGVESFAFEKGVSVNNVSREIIKRAGKPVNKVAENSIDSLAVLAISHEMQSMPEHAGKTKTTINQTALAKQKGYKNLKEYQKNMALNRMVPFTRALLDAGLNEKEIRIIIKSKYSKDDARKLSEKAIEKAKQSRELINKGLLLPGKVEAPKRRKKRI